MDNDISDSNQTLGNGIQDQVPPSTEQAFAQPSNQNVAGVSENSIQSLMTFKQFTLAQSDNLSPNELIEMYDSYKTKYVQRNKSDFIDSNKSSPFLLEKFHPIWIRKIIEVRRNLVVKRADLFINKLVNGKFSSINRVVSFDSSYEYQSNPSERDEISNFDNITVLREPYFEVNMNSHVLLLTEVPTYISCLDILDYFTNQFPLPDGTFGACRGFLDLSLSTPKFNRGILNRQCYVLFDNNENRNNAFEGIKGKIIKSSFSTQKISHSYLQLDYHERVHDYQNIVGQHGQKYYIYVVQAKLFNDNVPTRFGTLPKIFSTNEQLCSDKKNMLRIIEKIEKDQNIEFRIDKIIEDMFEKNKMEVKKIVDILAVYLRFVHGIDYYTFTVARLFQNKIENHHNYTENGNNSDFSDTISPANVTDSSPVQLKRELFNSHRSLLLLSRGYIETMMRNRFKGGWLRNEALTSEIQTYDSLIENQQSKSALTQLNRNIEGLLKLPSVFELIPESVSDNDEVLLFNWKRYCEQHAIRKKPDRWQCAKCLKQFKGEEFVSKHLNKKHKDFLDVVKDELIFERIIKPLSGKFSYLIHPNLDDSGSNHMKRGNHQSNMTGPIRSKYNKYQRPIPYERNNYFKDWDTPKTSSAFQNRCSNQFDIRTTIKYDDL
ncbi:protein with C2H2 Zn finger [Cryptosporidium ryanae]|uniref:protein with C2H2 Zn finger n=1 Tax=Cryptosporidium ryanae TaxID=515981 RepID=UPI00351A1E8A|nr:protein with C2H2 Zn finger [Cryptosporidium ryanae]